jgi:hypothetical protein
LGPTRAFWPVALALILILLIPFLVVDVPPVLDYPNHLARWFVLAHPDDPFLSRFYAPNWHITPNIGLDPLGVLLVRFLPVHVAGRFTLALAMLAPVLGTLAYARAAFGKWTAWSLGVTLTGFNGVFFLGFLNFLFGIGLAMAAAGGWIVLRRRGRDMEAVLMGGVAGAVIFLSHIFGVAFFALLIAVQEIAQYRQARADLPRRAMLVAAALVPALALYMMSPLAGHEAAIAGWDGKHKLWNLFAPFMTYNKPLTLATGLAVLAALTFLWRSAEFAPGTRLALALLIPLYLAAPVTLKGGSFVDIRLALMMGLLLFSGISPRLTPGRERRLMLGITALVALRSLYTGSAWLDHRKDLAELRAAIAQVEPGALVLAAHGHNSAGAVVSPERNLPDTEPMDSHLPALLVIERRAFWPNLFADPVQQPVTVRPAYARIARPLYDPVPWDWFTGPLTPQVLKLEPYLRNWRADFDYVLLLDRPASLPPRADLIPLYAGPYAVLYRIRR